MGAQDSSDGYYVFECDHAAGRALLALADGARQEATAAGPNDRRPLGMYQAMDGKRGGPLLVRQTNHEGG